MSKPLFRVPTVRRILLNRELTRLVTRLQERDLEYVLDIGAKHAPYRNLIRCRSYLTADIDPSTQPDLVCDVHHIDWESDYFDAIIATEVLEHLYDPQQAVSEFHRILKPGGICILSVPFMYEYHADPYDFYRYTQDGLAHLFSGFKEVEISPHGNRLQAIWLLLSGSKRTLGLISWLNPLVARLDWGGESKTPLGFVVWAVK